EEGEEGAGGGLRVALAGGDLALLGVADGDGGVPQGLGVVRAGGGRIGPERGPPVEVEDGVRAAGAGPQGGEGGGAAGFLAEAGAGGPQDAGGADRVEVQFVRVDLQVGGLGAAVEGEGEVVGREEGAEGDGGGVLGDLGDPAG